MAGRKDTGGEIHELPDRDTGEGLTNRQRKVLEVIRNSVDRRGYPPSMREIGEAVGLTSPSSVAHQLASLERKGYLRRDPMRPRAIEVVSPDAPNAPGYRGHSVSSADPDATIDETGIHDERPEASTSPSSARLPPASRSRPTSWSRMSSRSPSRSSARAPSSCSRSSGTR